MNYEAGMCFRICLVLTNIQLTTYLIHSFHWHFDIRMLPCGMNPQHISRLDGLSTPSTFVCLTILNMLGLYMFKHRSLHRDIIAHGAFPFAADYMFDKFCDQPVTSHFQIYKIIHFLQPILKRGLHFLSSSPKFSCMIL